MLNLNPEIVDQERVRKMRRKRLIRYFIGPIIVLLLIGMFFLRTGVFNVAFAIVYNGGNFDSAETMANLQSFGNIVSPYIVHFDKGNTYFRKGKYKEAEKEFRSSLKESPPESELCKIYINFSLSVEKQGDEAFNSKDFGQSLILYNSAKAILYENGGVDEHDKEKSKDERGKVAEERLEEKRRKADRENSRDDGDGGDDGNDQKPTTKGVSDEDLDKIKAKQNPGDLQTEIRLRTGGSSGSYGRINW